MNKVEQLLSARIGALVIENAKMVATIEAAEAQVQAAYTLLANQIQAGRIDESELLSASPSFAEWYKATASNNGV